MPNLANQLGDEVLNLLVQAYCKGGLTYKGRIIFNEMLLRDITIENGKYTAPMVGLGFCMIGEVGEAANVVQDMLLKELFPDAEIYNMLFQGYCEANCLRKVKELGVLIRKFSSPSISSYQNLVRLMYGNSLLVDELLNELQEKGLLLDEVAYNFLIYGFSKCKDVSGCLHYLSTMISKGFRPSYRSLRTAVTCLCDLGF
ncbi:hypothetical protein GH714_012361 [Hevea brasiliensis]|uniref:Pentacotripeptide-repeat region of PRORP domain-containing protein n=1 Tax=Hevea brasiliensis TaxID=3981 RepID=A0A6A6MK12_HEVBR|nr:hypothetical protein GH714_012361 [Hevea brasiliensis]